MNKAPAFQFYANDFLGGTLEMSPAEVGTYIRLLCYQWVNDSLPNDQEKCARIAGASVEEIAAVWGKFTLGDDGRMRNARLVETRTQSEEYRERQRENGAKGGRPRNPDESQTKPKNNPPVSSGLTQPEPTENPLANPNETSSSSTSSSISTPAPSSPPPSPPPKPPAASPPGGQGPRLPTTEPEIFISELFNRRLSTPWSEKELKAFRKIRDVAMDDLRTIKTYYESERKRGADGIHRRDMQTFLNNYPGELDRARNHANGKSKGQYPESIQMPIL